MVNFSRLVSRGLFQIADVGIGDFGFGVQTDFESKDELDVIGMFLQCCENMLSKIRDQSFSVSFLSTDNGGSADV